MYCAHWKFVKKNIFQQQQQWTNMFYISDALTVVAAVTGRYADVTNMSDIGSMVDTGLAFWSYTDDCPLD